MADRIYKAKYIPSLKHPEDFEEFDLYKISKNNYNDYKGKLYCPEANCLAPLVFVNEREKCPKYFRTYPYSKKIGERHIEGCRYGVEHNLGKISGGRKGTLNPVNVSEEHIHRRIKDIFNNMDDDNGARPNSQGKQKRKNPTKRMNEGNRVKRLIQDGSRINKTREPNIPNKSIDDVTTSDYSEGNNRSLLAINGTISGNVIVREDQNAYIDILRKDHKKARVFFSEEFRMKSHHDSIDKFREYINSLTGKKIVVCVGYIREMGDYDINIYPSSERCFAINRCFYGDMVNLLQTEVL